MPPSDSLDSLRSQIDAIDDQLIHLLNRRAAIALDIGKIKKTAGADLYTPEREQAICDRLTRMNPGPFPNEALTRLFREIMQATLFIEGGKTTDKRADLTRYSCS